MRRLVLVCLIASAATAAGGCFISSDDDDDLPPDGELGFITANWDFQLAAGGTLDCPPGFGTVRVEARGPEVIDDLYDCVDFSSGPADYIPGDYDMTIVVTDDAETDIYATSLTYAIDITAEDAEFGEIFIDDGGRVQVGVNLTDTATGAPLTCAEGGVDGIGLIFTVVGSTDFVEDLFNCEDAADGAVAITSPLAAGDYTASISAINEAEQALGPETPESITVLAPNDYVDLIGIEVDVD